MTEALSTIQTLAKEFIAERKNSQLQESVFTLTEVYYGEAAKSDLKELWNKLNKGKSDSDLDHMSEDFLKRLHKSVAPSIWFFWDTHYFRLLKGRVTYCKLANSSQT